MDAKLTENVIFVRDTGKILCSNLSNLFLHCPSILELYKGNSKLIYSVRKVGIDWDKVGIPTLRKKWAGQFRNFTDPYLGMDKKGHQ